MSEAVLPTAPAAAGLPPLVAGLLRRRLSGWTHGRLSVAVPRGRCLLFGAGPGPEVAVAVHDYRALLRLALSGALGWAEAYVAGEWDTPDLSAFLTAAARNLDVAGDADGTLASRVFHRLMHLSRVNTRAGSRRNIAAHYDLGNEFYRLWLDPSMTYSSAIFGSRAEPLEAAQQRKHRRLCDALRLAANDHVLEIGCGWGGFAEVAARDYGCRVTALTVSARQAAFARERLARQGLSSRVEVRLQDYRDVREQFSAVASVEMFEAVGERHWPAYFRTLARCLAPGARAAVQTITIADGRFEGYRRSADFIQRYIFPGGMLPSPSVFRSAAAAAGLSVADAFTFGADYAATLRRWSRAFNAAWPDIAALGFDARFRRLWNYYLSYCEAGFNAGYTDVAQFLLVRD
jgi:cyclopropane-fatty-acyl-phospholipid synthase